MTIRRRRNKDGPAPLSNALDALMANFGAPPAAEVRGVFAGWAEIVGEQVAAHTTPTSLRDGVLLVDVDDPAWASQLTFMEADLLGCLEQYLGEASVREIRHRVRPRSR